MKKLKKLITAIIAFVMLIENLIFVIPPFEFSEVIAAEVTASSGFSGGCGTQEEPWEIASVEDLLYFASQVDSGTSFSGQYVKLMNDLDLSVIDNWKPIGNTSSMTTGTNVFKGDFDGNNKIVENCNIKVDSTIKYGNLYLAGFFAMLQNATVHDLELKNITIEFSNSFRETTTNWEYIAGGLAGKIVDSSNIYNCTVRNFKHRENSKIAN